MKFDVINDSNLMKLHSHGIKVFFTNIDKLKEKMLDEIK